MANSAASEVGHLTDADDHKAVVESSKIPVLLDFYATWCPPCRALSPHVEALAIQQKGKIKVLKVNVDDNSGLALRYAVSSMPTLVIVLPDGKTIRHVGSKDLRGLTKWVEESIK